MNGTHSIPADQYHASEAVSNSRLKDIAHPKTPAHYKAKWIDKIVPEVTTPAMEFGSLLHRCLLEPETCKDAFHVKPEDMSFATKEGKAWRAEHEGRIIIGAEQERMVLGMTRSLLAHPVSRKALEYCDRERSLFVQDKGLDLKSRLDLMPNRAGWNSIYDIKTIEEADADSASKAGWTYGYFRQAAFYLHVAKLLGLPLTTFTFIFVEKSPPYLVHPMEINPAYLEAGTMLIERDLFLLRQCQEKNEWPGYGHDIGDLQAPPWAQKQLEALASA